MLPREIWQIILRYSISVPDFFDVNIGDRVPPWCTFDSDWNNPTLYWASERILNSLRRVCRSWDTYLQHYAHRFVRMDDVVHRLVPVHYLKSAVRVSLGDHKCQFCSMCQLQQQQHRQEIAEAQEANIDYSGLYMQILRQNQPFRATMLDYSYSENQFVEQTILPSAFPNLVVVQVLRYSISAAEVIRFIESCPSFRHSFVSCFWNPGSMAPLKSLILTTLTLSLEFTGSLLKVLTHEDLYLPALRHLYIQPSWSLQGSAHVEPLYFPFLRLTGRELRTLHLPREKGLLGDISGELWNICPKAEHMHLAGQKTTVPPPVDHPVHTVSINWYEIWLGDPLHAHVPDWPRLRTVRLDSTWDGPLTSAQLENFDSRLHLEDSLGESYANYLLRLNHHEIKPVVDWDIDQKA
jgi:hypothetical protein